MKINIMSDLHLEFGQLATPAADSDLILMAGDIGVRDSGIAWAIMNTNTPVLMINGNHEYYGNYINRKISVNNVIETVTREYQLDVQDINTDVQVLDNTEVIVNDKLRVLGCTLWTDFNLNSNFKSAMAYAQGRMNDYRKIRVLPTESLLTTSVTRDKFLESVAWLNDKLNEDFDGKTIVMTHHCPSKDSLHVAYKGDALNPAYASDLEYLFPKVDYWVHGHVHNSLDYVKDGCNVVCNPRGYHNYEENPDFDVNRAIEI